LRERIAENADFVARQCPRYRVCKFGAMCEHRDPDAGPRLADVMHRGRERRDAVIVGDLHAIEVDQHRVGAAIWLSRDWLVQHQLQALQQAAKTVLIG